MAVHVGAALRLLLRSPRATYRRAAFDFRRWAIIAAVFLAALLLLALTIDGPLARGARALPEWVGRRFDEITTFGKSAWFLWPLGVALLVASALPDRLPRQMRLTAVAILVRAQFLFAAIAVPGIVVNIFKHVIGRGRPFVGGSLDPLHFNPFSWPAAYASIPSGHAATAAAVAVAVSTLWPRTRTVMWIYVLLILTSRVVLTAHYLSDVLAGAAVGILGVVMVRRYFAARRLGFSTAPDGSIVCFPPPSARRAKAVARALLAE